MRVFASLLLCTALLALPLLANAQEAAPTAASPAATSESQATAFVGSVGSRALDVMKSGKGASAIQSQLETLFNEVVDVDWVAKFVMGRNWRALTPAQQQSYMSAYRTFLIKHYTSNFTEYTQGTTFKVLRATAQQRGEQLVSTQIVRPGKPPVNIDYRVRGDKVIDIAVEGVSLITTQRQEFASVMQRYGFDYLLNQLQQKTQAAIAKAAGAPVADTDAADGK